jgi:two-component system, NarL family, response regulator NreC
MITILLADDHSIVRQGLRALLEVEPDFCIVGEAADGLEVTQLIEYLRPDVLVLDLMMPGLDGLEVTRRVNQHSPQTRVIILSMYGNEAYVVEGLRNGAAGYVLKKSTADELVRAVRAVVAGQRYLSPPLSEQTIEAYMQKADESTQNLYDLLTAREREVLYLVAEGHTNAEIAARLFISPRTVEMHRANLMRKLDLRSQADLIRYALRRGIGSLNSDN